jgi:hypothetical protein
MTCDQGGAPSWADGAAGGAGGGSGGLVLGRPGSTRLGLIVAGRGRSVLAVSCGAMSGFAGVGFAETGFAGDGFAA